MGDSEGAGRGDPLRRAATFMADNWRHPSSVALLCGALLWRLRLRMPGTPRPRFLAPVTLRGFRGYMHLLSDELGAYQAAVVDDLYDQALSESVAPDWVILDVGAHVGHFALSRAKTLDPAQGGRLVAFDPDERTQAVLRKNVTRSALADRIEVVTTAVGHVEGVTRFVRSANTQAGHLEGFGNVHGVKRAMRGEAVEVAQITLDGWAKRQGGLSRVDLVKINVEGAELEVLRGAESNVLPVTSRLLVSIESAGGVDSVTDFLVERGFKLHGVAGDVHAYIRRPGSPRP